MTLTRAALTLSAIVLSAGAALAASDAMDNPMVGGAPMLADMNSVENAVNSADHTTLVAAVKAAGLVDTLASPGPVTVFAPVNDAFATLPAGTDESGNASRTTIADVNQSNGVIHVVNKVLLPK